MKEIQLTQGKVAIIDDEDFERLRWFNWIAAKNGYTFYAVCHVRINGKQKRISMHRMILNPPKDMCVDHKDRNGLNNTRANLRLASSSQNSSNRIGAGLLYKGVSKSGKNTYRAYCRQKYLGLFKTERQAAIAYNKAAKEMFGEFALLNDV